MRETRIFEVRNKLGIHARVAAKLVEEARRYKARIFFEYEGQEVNGKSLLGILTLACGSGGRMKVRAEGSDADKALLALERLFANKFGEE
ncbi:MAG: HPr family phosphocarrier protein [Pseudomonadota bacterium]|nr:HPr family phosphocarrier protein [Pseudomonadota bacterium]